MGLIFGLFFAVITVGAVAFIITLFAALIALIGRKKTREKRVKNTVLSSFVGIVTFALCSCPLYLILTSFTNTDIGIGDSFYVPLENSYSISFVDSPYVGIIERNGESVILWVTRINLNKDIVTGEADGKYFILDTSTHKLIKDSKNVDEAQLFDASSFYHHRYWQVNRLGILLICLFGLLAASYAARLTIKEYASKPFLIFN